MNATYARIQKITLTAMLLALAGVFTIISKVISVPGIRFASVNLAPAFTMFASITLGPGYGLLVGVGSDLIGLSYSTGVYNFFYTLIAGLYGVLPWLFMLISKRFRHLLKFPYVIYGILLIIVCVLAGVFYGTDIFDQSNAMGENAYWLKPLVLVGAIVLSIGLAVGLYFTNRYFKKGFGRDMSIPSPNEIALICLIVELILGVFGKSLALSYYFEVLADAGATFLNTAYPYLLAFVLVMLPIDVIIYTFVIAWLSIYFHKFARAKGLEIAKKQEEEDVPKFDSPYMSEYHKDLIRSDIPWGWLIASCVILALIIVCVIVIVAI